MSARDEAIRAAARIINAEGGEPGSSLHSWRCSYYVHPPCTCVDDLAEKIVDAVSLIAGTDGSSHERAH